MSDAASAQAVSFKDILAQAVSGAELAPALMEQAFDTILRGEATAAQIGGLLIALRMKGETAEEITGAAMAMRERVTPLDFGDDTMRARLVDTCGTGAAKEIHMTIFAVDTRLLLRAVANTQVDSLMLALGDRHTGLHLGILLIGVDGLDVHELE